MPDSVAKAWYDKHSIDQKFRVPYPLTGHMENGHLVFTDRALRHIGFIDTEEMNNVRFSAPLYLEYFNIPAASPKSPADFTGSKSK